MPTVVFVLMALAAVGAIWAGLRRMIARRSEGYSSDATNFAKWLSAMSSLGAEGEMSALQRHREMLNVHQENLRRIRRYRPQK